MSEFLLIVMATVIGSLVSAGILALVRHYWRQWQERRLLRACQELSGGDRGAAVAEYELVARAKMQEPGPVLTRLLRKEEITPHTRTGCFAITHKGPEALQRLTLRGLRQRLVGW